MSKCQEICTSLESNPRTWLITGTAGFIGANLLEHPALPKVEENIGQRQNIGRAAGKLGYAPECRIVEGVARAMPWYLEH
ncbi:MAG: hypothetical protein M0P11_08575 [Anaerolineaceae bacterium]|nr:hypothetical protein [Anaerolineaceae bacterium]